MDKPVIVWDDIDAQAEREAMALMTMGKARKQWGVTKSRFTAQNGGMFRTGQVLRHDVQRSTTYQG